MKNYKSIAISVLFAIGALSLYALWTLQYLRFDYEFEDYFPKGDDEYAYYNDFRKAFGSDNDFVLVSLANKEGVFNSEFLKEVDSLANQLKGVEYVDQVVTPTQLKYPVSSPFGLMSVSWLKYSDSNQLAVSAENVRESELIGQLIAKNEQSLNIILTTKYGISKAKSDQVVHDIREVLSGYTFDEINVAGRIFGQNYYVQMMESELMLFTLISLFIVIAFLIIAFRSFWGVIFPLIVVGLSVVWLVSLMVITGKSFDIMSSLLPTIIFVVGTSDVIHIISRYYEELRIHPNKLSALSTAFKHVGKATFLTSVTTSIGFATLYTSGIVPVRDFGLYTAAGVMIAFVITFMVLPALLYLLPIPKRAMVKNDDLFWDIQMRRIFKWIIAHSKLVLVLGAGVILVSLYGISRVEVNNYLLEDLSEGDPMKKSFQFFEENYSGARPLEVIIQTNDSTEVLTYSNILALAEVEEALINTFELTGVLSVNTLMKSLNRAYHGGNQSYYIIPESETEFNKILKQVKGLIKSGKANSLIQDDLNRIRITGRVKDFGGKLFQVKYDQVNDRIQSVLLENNLTIRYTGMGYLIDKNNETLAGDLMGGLLLAFIAVGLIMGLIFKSFKMVLITLVPNMFPLLVIGGIMGFTGIDLKVSTSIIFTIAFGIAVDDTIHYVSKLKMELNKGRTLLYALKRASISTGKAITLTSLILVSGFFALVFSDFASTYYIGLMVSITLLIAVLADLFLLPVLIIAFFRVK